jgi:hypothetical protein
MSNKKKNDTLGMPHGTAANRLRKIILFNLLVRHKENICFKCGQEISTVEEISIEHKLPWEGIDAKLFWDLSNIAFSHLLCNKQDRRPDYRAIALKLRRVPPEGTNWCIIHKAFLPNCSFGVSKHRWTGLHNVCKEHQHYSRI